MRAKKEDLAVTSFSYHVSMSEMLREFDIIATRERKSKSELIVDLIQEYVKTHGSGNNTFKLDTWNEDPEFQAVPTISSKPETWYKYLNECTDKERLNIQVLSFRINQQCKSIKGLK